jgi:hypothetical protein
VGQAATRKHLGWGLFHVSLAVGSGSVPSGLRLMNDIGKLGIRKSAKIRKIEKLRFDLSFTDFHLSLRKR